MGKRGKRRLPIKINIVYCRILSVMYKYGKEIQLSKFLNKSQSTISIQLRILIVIKNKKFMLSNKANPPGVADVVLKTGMSIKPVKKCLNAFIGDKDVYY